MGSEEGSSVGSDEVVGMVEMVGSSEGVSVGVSDGAELGLDVGPGVMVGSSVGLLENVGRPEGTPLVLGAEESDGDAVGTTLVEG